MRVKETLLKELIHLLVEVIATLFVIVHQVVYRMGLLLRVVLASSAMGACLFYSATHWDWTALRATPWQRIGLMTGVLTASAVLYFAALRGLGLDLRALFRR